MPNVPLGFGKYAIVDSSDLPEVARHNWFLTHNGHAMAWIKTDGIRRKVCMHTHLMQPDHGGCIHHINGIKLDYRRANLRVVLPNEAAATGWRYRRNRLSRFRGVTMNTQRTRWLAQRWVNENGRRRLKFLGSFLTEEEAAHAYADQIRSEARSGAARIPET